MATPVEIVNPEIVQWYTEQNLRNADRDICTLIATGLLAAQMIIYYDLWDDQIDKRDDMIDREELIRDDLHRRDIDVDVPRLKLKQDILGVSIPAPNLCADAVLCADESENDGQAVDLKATQMSNRACGGIPSNWGIHEGTLLGAKAGAYAGGLLANAAKRREEVFREAKTKLALRAQQSARLDIGPALQQLGQASAIHAGKADIFLAGFNSAGASLGVALGRLANTSGTTSTGGQGSSAFGSGATTLGGGPAFSSGGGSGVI